MKLRTRLRLKREILLDRVAAVLLRLAYRCDPDLEGEHRQNELGAEVAHLFMRCQITEVEARQKFYSAFY